MDDPAREHFDRISSRYERASESWQTIYDRVAARVDPLVKGGRVLDVGSGGEFPYDTTGAREVIALDVSPSMLEGIDAPNVTRCVGDARDLRAFGDASTRSCSSCRSTTSTVRAPGRAARSSTR